MTEKKKKNRLWREEWQRIYEFELVPCSSDESCKTYEDKPVGKWMAMVRKVVYTL